MPNIYLEYIIKVAADNSTNKIAGGLGVGVAGSAYTMNQFNRGHITGRETLYHGTSKKNAESILREGLKPNRHEHGISGAFGLGEMNTDLSFLAKKKHHAKWYAAQQEAIEEMGGKVGPEDILLVRARASRKINTPGYTPAGLLKAKVPTWKEGLKAVPNPEDSDEHFYKQLKENNVQAPEWLKKVMVKILRQNLGPSDVHVHKSPEGLSSEFFTKSPNYRPNSAEEFRQYVKHNPLRFTKGVGKASVGLAGLLGGAKLVHDGVRERLSSNAD
jgi:hypothetical protein